MSLRRVLILAVSPLVLLAACGGSDDESAPGTVTESTTTAAVDTDVDDTVAPVVTDATAATDAPTTSTAPVETAAPTTVVETTAPPTTAAPDALQQLPGVETITVTAAGDDPARPTFSWTAPATAVDYELVVQDAGGTPLWAWTGAEVTVVLGGAARAREVEGPTLTGPSQVRVFAFDATGALVGTSAWTPLAG
jgi:hypothetical protein